MLEHYANVWASRADLYHASRTGDKLRYPPLRAYCSIMANGKYIPDRKAKALLQTLGTGFDDLDESFVSAELCGAIAQGIEATVALDHYHRYENEQPRLVDVMLAANEAQRSFLEIQPKRGSGLGILTYECCRLTALVSCLFHAVCKFPSKGVSHTSINCEADLRRKTDLQRHGPLPYAKLHKNKTPSCRRIERAFRVLRETYRHYGRVHTVDLDV